MDGLSFELTYQIVFQIFHFWNAFHFVNFTISAPINTNFWEHFKEVVCHINAWLMYDLNKKFAFRNMLVHIKKIKTHASIVWLPSSIRISFFHYIFCNHIVQSFFDLFKWVFYAWDKKVNAFWNINRLFQMKYLSTQFD